MKMAPLAVGFLLALFRGLLAGDPAPTPLDQYVAAADEAYSWKLVASHRADGYTYHIVDMVSQTWRSAREVDRPVWRHWLLIVRPDKITSDTAFLYIGGGDNGDPPPRGAESLLVDLAMSTGTVAAEVRMIPNQPLVVLGEEDNAPHIEDDLIAHSWVKYLTGGDDQWPVQLAMVKAAVRAMDTVAAVVASEAGGNGTIERFVVSGASKRGWTSWLTAAVDRRVRAVAPIVIDMLNLATSMRHHYAAQGHWAPVLRPYVRHGITEWRDHPRYQQLLDFVDPYAYRHRLTMPKLIVNASQDEFFLPDSSQFYYDDLPGPKSLCYVAGANHGQAGRTAWPTILAFYESVLGGRGMPRIAWTFEGEDAIRVMPDAPAAQVRLWQATNREARIFRHDAVGPLFEATVLKDEGGGVYLGRVQKPDRGWRAYMVEVTFDGANGRPFSLSTPVRITPDTLPYELP